MSSTFTKYLMNIADSHIYFPIQDVRFSDLFDWSDPSQKCRTSRVTMKGQSQPGNQTGAMTDVNETKVAIFRYHDQVYAINEKCPHAGGPLHVGDIEVLPDRSVCVRCPWHSWRFDLQTGQVKHPKGRNLFAKIYPVKVREDGTLLIGFEEFCPEYFNTIDF